MRRKKKKPLKTALFLFLLLTICGAVAFFYRTKQQYQQVMALESEVVKQAEKNGISEYRELILSMILTESKGLGNDPMQSSESAYGEAGRTSDPSESIAQGVSYLAESIALAQDQGVDLWTAVQAYNFGLDYIYFVESRGGVNDLTLAEEYSRDYLAPQLGNHDQEQYRYWRIFPVFHNGGYLYYNGGNFFYAPSVKWNQQKMQFFHYLDNLW